ncbi:uncharacterized protein LAESUDRAFT_753672 [Laetiporus sulphureus 93-53]|uniref:DASH complex subunit DAM1 n=1 Tax=Laetiporus sulphureus 93-53 TaxID=1314785 RepID=A0A165I570_9APHY|nr:uncharacterized protein LAESUDRAFT_753672 [Laetiporus sulphureus 93-53]KZT12604.1 hypothetical protein LAESUDRAFT_753672 [Laetiporus sulphureus 93-53]
MSMRPSTSTQRTPLRRISQGSLSRLARSGAYPDAPYGLGFLEPALSELVDEMEALNNNIQGLRALGDALGTFNESFASWLYIMNMNALTVDWPQAPTEASFALAARRADEDAAAALAALQAMQAAQASPPRPPSPNVSTHDKTAYAADATEPSNDTTFAVPNTTATSSGSSAKGPVKKKGKPKLTAKERKQRSMLIDRVVSALPLEFRGNDPNLRRNVETVIEGFLDRPERGVALLELVKPPDLNQARVNKCLIALVNRKIVQKDNSSGAVLYHWHGLPD